MAPTESTPAMTTQRKQDLDRPPDPDPALTLAEAVEAALALVLLRQARRLYPGSLLILQKGPLCYLASEDVDTAARAGLAVTRQDAALATFPACELEPVLQRLLQAGHRVVVLDKSPSLRGDGRGRDEPKEVNP